MGIGLYVLVSCLVNWQIKLIGATLFYDLVIPCGIAREVKDHVYVKRQTRIVPRDQVSPLLVVYCSLFLHRN